MSLPKKYRLAKKKSIDAIFKGGKTVQGSFFFVKYLPNSLRNPRVVVTVSKRAAKTAVQRNKTKRKVTSVIYEYVRNMNIDLALVVTAPILDKPETEIKSEIEQNIKQIKVK